MISQDPKSRPGLLVDSVWPSRSLSVSLRNLASGWLRLLSKSSSKPEHNLKLHCSSSKARGASRASPTVSPLSGHPALGCTPHGGHECRLEQLGSLVASNRNPFQLTQAKGTSLKSHHELMKLTAGQRKGLGNSSRPGNRGHNKPRWTTSSTGIN